jgi:hypothetical protein
MAISSAPIRVTFFLAVTMISIGIAAIIMGALYFEKEVAKQLTFEIGIAALSAGMVGFVYDYVVRSDFLDQIKDQLEKFLTLMLHAWALLIYTKHAPEKLRSMICRKSLMRRGLRSCSWV